MSNSLRQAATSMMFKLRSWLAKLRSHKHQEPSAEQGTSQADKLSTTSSEPVVKAAREPYQDSPNFAKFRKMHSSYSKAPLIHVYLEVIGATGIGVKSLVNKLIYDDMHGGERLQYEKMMMTTQQCFYYCGGKVYDLDVWSKPYPDLWDNESGLLNARTMRLLDERRKGGRNGYIGVRKRQSVVFAYDISSRASFEELMRRYDDLFRYYNPVSSASPITILGLKADVRDNEREVSREELYSFAASHGCLSGECSARTGWGVDEVFSHIVESVHSTI